jgi:tetratricopeptide (TPR) repeat protein
MPPGNEGQPSDVDLDQKIAECSRAIALNQNDAKAYRDRGLLLARKREYDPAMSDLNNALSLNSNDAHAFGLRGLVWEKKNDSKRALADLEKAIQLDPANAVIYSSHRENKRCKKCDRDLPLDMFRDDGAKSGLGRHCRECKSTTPKLHRARFRRSYRR